MRVDEEMMILRMLQEGKITAEEAQKLLEALDSGGRKGRADAGKPLTDFAVDLSELSERIQQTVASKLERLPDMVEWAQEKEPRLGWLGGQRFEERLSGSFGSAREIGLELHGLNGRIELRPSSDDAPHVHLVKYMAGLNREEARRRAEHMVDVVWAEDRLSIHHRPLSLWRSGGVAMTLELPVGHAYALDVRTTNGRVQVGGLELAGGTVETSNGPIELLECSGRAPDVETSNGKIVVSGLRGSLSAATSNGRIDVIAAPDPGEAEVAYRLKTSNGSIRVRLAPQPDTGYAVDLGTTLGHIRVQLDVPLVGGRSSRTSFVGRTEGFESQSRKVTVAARTSNGSIRLEGDGEARDVEETSA